MKIRKIGNETMQFFFTSRFKIYLNITDRMNVTSGVKLEKIAV